LLVNEEKILPMPCITGVAQYPDGLKEALKSEIDKTYFVKAQEKQRKKHGERR